MQKEQFETRIKELLPNMTEQAMDKGGRLCAVSARRGRGDFGLFLRCRLCGAVSH